MVNNNINKLKNNLKELEDLLAENYSRVTKKRLFSQAGFVKKNIELELKSENLKMEKEKLENNVKELEKKSEEKSIRIKELEKSNELLQRDLEDA
jgi:S-adenosylmethionine:tRNA-ribosyltransferase-isomerase (queuine synthetase)